MYMYMYTYIYIYIICVIYERDQRGVDILSSRVVALRSEITFGPSSGFRTLKGTTCTALGPLTKRPSQTMVSMFWTRFRSPLMWYWQVQKYNTIKMNAAELMGILQAHAGYSVLKAIVKHVCSKNTSHLTSIMYRLLIYIYIYIYRA